jgi:Predicted membrane protein
MNFDLRKYIIAAALTVLIWVMALTPLGYIPFFGVDITLICIPVIIGAIALGLPYGLFLGLMFALTSLFMALMGRAGVLLAPLLDLPLPMYLTIFIPRLLIPIFTWLACKATAKWKPPLSYGVSTLVGALSNTVFFLGFAYFLAGDQISASFQMSNHDLLAALGEILRLNGLLEAAVAVLVCVPVSLVLKRIIDARQDMEWHE